MKKQRDVKTRGGRVFYGVLVGIALVIVVEQIIVHGFKSAIVAIWCDRGQC
jgi:hypothetical protein